MEQLVIFSAQWVQTKSDLPPLLTINSGQTLTREPLISFDKNV